MIGLRGFAFLLCTVILAMTGIVFARKRETGFLDRTITLGATTYLYQVFVPADWSNNKKWPIILFLHGAGERGDDGILQTEVGIGLAIRRNKERFPSIVVLPQCRKNLWWTSPEMEAMALKALDQTMHEFSGDPHRTYLTGLSMGGYGAWDIAAKSPGKFAALVPICGGIRPPANVPIPPGSVVTDPGADPYAEVAQKIGKTPVWVFHGAADPRVPVSESRKIVAALKAAGAKVQYTEYEGVGHNSWDKAYAEPDLLPWLLSQQNPLATKTPRRKETQKQ